MERSARVVAQCPVIPGYEVFEKPSGRSAIRKAIHMSEKSPYTANLCPLSAWFELAGFREDFGESIGELIEAMLRSAIWQRAAEHLDGMLSEQQ